MIYQSTDTWMTSRETCFLCFVQHGARFENVCEIQFRIKAREILEKSSTGAIYKKEKCRNGDKRALDYFRMPKLQEIFTTRQLPSCFIAMRDSPFRKIFSPLSCFEQGKTLKNFLKKLCTVEIKKKRRSRDEK